MIIEGGVRKYGCAWMSSLARCRHRGRFASGRQGFVEMRTLPGVLPGEWRTPGTWEKKIIHYEIHRETLPALDQTNAEREERRWTSLFSTHRDRGSSRACEPDVSISLTGERL